MECVRRGRSKRTCNLKCNGTGKPATTKTTTTTQNGGKAPETTSETTADEICITVCRRNGKSARACQHQCGPNLDTTAEATTAEATTTEKVEPEVDLSPDYDCMCNAPSIDLSPATTTLRAYITIAARSCIVKHLQLLIFFNLFQTEYTQGLFLTK